MLKTLRRGFLILLAALPLFAQAEVTPQALIEQKTQEMMKDLNAHKAQYRSKPEALYASMDNIIGPIVDAEGMARSIMNTYAKQASPEQMARFKENVRHGLMQFYSNGMLEFDPKEIKVLPSAAPTDDRASIRLEVHGGKGETHEVSYTMVNSNGQWLMRNLVMSGLNIGKIYRDQFAHAMQENGGNLDKTIDGWTEMAASADQGGDKAK